MAVFIFRGGYHVAPKNTSEFPIYSHNHKIASFWKRLVQIMEPTFFIITATCVKHAIISNICIQHLFSFGRIPPPATSTIHNAYRWNNAHHLHQSHRQLASGRYVRGSAIAPVPASPFITPHQNWLLNKAKAPQNAFR